jgi:hypothetical protein
MYPVSGPARPGSAWLPLLLPMMTNDYYEKMDLPGYPNERY